MSLFVCEACDCIENTALSNFWARSANLHDGRALCSACDLTVPGGWHGYFPRRQYDPNTDHVQFKDGEWVAATSEER